MGCCGVKMLAVHTRLDERESEGNSPDGNAKKQMTSRSDTDLIMEASERIAAGGLRSIYAAFVHDSPKTTTTRSLEERGLSLDALVHFMTAFGLLDARMIVVNHIVRLLTAGTGRSFAELLEGKSWGSGEQESSDRTGANAPEDPPGHRSLRSEEADSEVWYLGTVDFFVTYTMDDRMEDCLDAIQRHEQNLRTRRKNNR
jgi:hypothetical protein